MRIKILPQIEDLFIPVIKALIELSGSGTIEEINEKVYEILKISDKILEIPHNEIDSRTEVEYRLAWARTYLKKYGLITNSSSGVWALTKSDINIDSLNSTEIYKSVRGKNHKKIKKKDKQEVSNQTEELIQNIEQSEEISEWKQQILNILYDSISPQAFERLAQRLLRESGFTQVEVTGRTGDGGIDGKGIVKINGFLSFHVIFQCKKYKGSISSGQIRDFRGAMQGRGEKGLFITTGTFTRDAIKEASRDGPTPIDLIDGDQLCDKLRELSLGVKKRNIEVVDIDELWFRNL